MKRLLASRVFPAAVALALLGSPAWAAVTPNSVVLPQGWAAGDVAQILPATGTGLAIFATGGANGSKVLSAVCSSTDSVAHTLLVYHVIGGTSYLVAAVSIPANAGDTPGTPPVQLITSATIPGPITGNGNRYFPLANGDTLSIAVTAAVTASDAVTCTGEQVNF